jgi:peptidylprolyl isomerase
MIQKGHKVTVHYTGKYENGDIFDTSIGKDPINFVVGDGAVINGFENAVIGKNVGDKIEVDIDPIDGYGSYRNDLIIEIPNSSLPGKVEIGTVLQAQSEGNNPVNVIVKEIKENSVIIDANHPLAGKKIKFDIEIISIS